MFEDTDWGDIGAKVIGILLISLLGVTLFSNYGLGAAGGDYWYSVMGTKVVPEPKMTTRTQIFKQVHNEFDWSDLWSSLLDNCSWQFEGDTGKGFVNQSQLIKVEYDYRNLSSHVSQYVNMTVKADIKDAGNYRATFKINQDAKSYIYDSKFANYTLKFDGYNVNFDWTEETKIVDAVISHSIANATKQTNRLTFSVTRNNLKANTTVNIDPTIGVDSTSSDGYAVSVAFDYATAHDATTGVVDDTDTSIVIATNKIVTFYYVYRGFLFFDTSPIGTGTITESILHIFPNEIHGNGFSVQIQNGQPTYPHDPLVVGDYNKAFYSGNGGSLSVDLMNPGVSYADIILTNDGMSWINTSGITKLCLRSTNDINNIAPTGQNDSIFDSIETGSSDPYLEVTYSINAEYYVIDTTSSIYSTSYPFQRKTFYCAGLYWAFYSPGTGSNDQPINYGTSPDGVTWTVHSSAFQSYQGNGYDFSLFFNGSHVAITRVTFQTVIAPQTTPFPTLSWRLGVPQSDGSISYSAIWQTVRKGSEMDYDRFPMVIIDDNGKSFISTYNRVGGNWYGTVYHNSMTDGTWSGTTSIPYSSDGSDNSRKFSLTPINSTCIYWFRVKNGVADIYGKIWNGATWSSEEHVVNDATLALQHSSVGMNDNVEFSYTVDEGATNYVYAKTRFSNGTWKASEVVAGDESEYSFETEIRRTNEIYHVTWHDMSVGNMTYASYNGTWLSEAWTDIKSEYCIGLTGFYSNYNDKIGMIFLNSTSTSVVWAMYDWASPAIPHEFYIENMDADNWLFAEYKYYDMNCMFYDVNDTAMLNFTDGSNEQLVMSYDVSEDTVSIVSGTGKYIVHITSTYNDTLDNTLNVTFSVYFTINVVDKLDVDFFLWGNDTNDASVGWTESQTDYANIYKAGGLYEDTIVNNASRIDNGNIFDLYATNNSLMRVDSYWRNLAQLQTVMQFPIPQTAGTYGGVWHYFGMEYYANGKWNDGFYVKFSWTTAESSSNYQFVNLTARFYMNSTLLKEVFNIMVFDREGSNATEAGYNLWVDLWFSSSNASQMCGMRIGAYEWAQYNTVDPWWRWTGDNWGIWGIQSYSSSVYSQLKDSDGNSVFCQNISMVKLWSEIEYPLSVATEWTAIQQHSERTDLVFQTPTISGITVPTIQEPKIPVVTMTSYTAFLKYNPTSYFGYLMQLPVTVWNNYLAPFISGVINVGLNVADNIIYSLTGTHIVASIVGFFNGLIGWFSTSITYITQVLTIGFGNIASSTFNIFNTISGTMTSNIVATGLIYIFNTLAAIIGISGAWLVGGIYTDGFGTTWDYSFMSGFNIMGISGGGAIIVLVIFITFLFELGRCLMIMSFEPLLQPVRIFIGIFQFIWMLAKPVIDIILKISHALISAIRG